MVAVVYWLPIGGFLAQADWLRLKVGGHWHCFCSHCVNWVNSRSALRMMTNDSTINIVLVLLLLLLVVVL